MNRYLGRPVYLRGMLRIISGIVAADRIYRHSPLREFDKAGNTRPRPVSGLPLSIVYELRWLLAWQQPCIVS